MDARASQGGAPGSAGPLDEAARERFADLMEKVANASDREAFAELFRYYAPRLKSYLTRQGASAGESEEIVQDVMMTVWRKAEMFDRAQASVSTWIFRIARNRRIDRFRRARKPDLDPQEPMILPASFEDPGARLDAEDVERTVRAALSELPEEQLQLLKMAFYEGLTHRDIAERLNLPLGTVKSRIRLAFGKMKGKLEDGA
jgi:RNA polymerase sigma-70 factor, ECF subfamily